MGPVLGLSEKVPEGELLPPGPGPSCSAGISVGEAASPAVGRTQWEQGGRAAAQDPSAVQPWPSFTSFTSGGGEGCGLLVTLGLSRRPLGMACSLPPSPRPSPTQWTPEICPAEPWSSLLLAHLGLCSEATWLSGVIPWVLGRCSSCSSTGQRPSGPLARCPCLLSIFQTHLPLKANFQLSTLGW